MATEVEYGLTQIDMGDWIRGKDERLGNSSKTKTQDFVFTFTTNIQSMMGACATSL